MAGRSNHGSDGIGLGVKFLMRQQSEVMHGQAQLGEGVSRRCIRESGLHALARPPEALIHRAMLVGVTQLAQEPADFVRVAPRLFDQPEGGCGGEAAGLEILEDTAFKAAALFRAVGVDPAGTISAQGRAGLGKTRDGRPGPRRLHRQAECLQFAGIIARQELHMVEERPVAAQPAREAELVGGFHVTPSNNPRVGGKPRVLGIPDPDTKKAVSRGKRPSKVVEQIGIKPTTSSLRTTRSIN